MGEHPSTAARSVLASGVLARDINLRLKEMIRPTLGSWGGFLLIEGNGWPPHQPPHQACPACAWPRAQRPPHAQQQQQRPHRPEPRALAPPLTACNHHESSTCLPLGVRGALQFQEPPCVFLGSSHLGSMPSLNR